ncbi:uncharacterized protein [Drosophila tropicalis]|uniref:uncharacterized protein n=1 Tax=Drosophila tropicalis TaxID=46794 RepID=UPI0035ABBCFD
MSFFRNIRSSLSSSRAKSSSRDTTPVRSSSSRPASVISTSTRRDSTTSSTLQRGDTFILNPSDEDRPPSNCSTLEKKSKKSKVFSKFSTFTKRKKTPSPSEEATYEHHPSDTATNTYYKWRNDGADSRLVDYDAQADPFNFLYEQQSSLKALQGDSNINRQSSIGSNSNSSGSFDSSTYRKSKPPKHLREQLEQLKTHTNADLVEDQQLEDDERDKYKTITLSSFRKSFRDRLIQQQKEDPHNPAWFVEVPQQTTASSSSDQAQHRLSKENRPDFLVFENDNYRPQSRSPLRDRPSRSVTRSPVKRNETFRVTQPRKSSPSPAPAAPSIRIEIKNSISPHSPGRFVPVGVAKPMPTAEYYAKPHSPTRHHQPAKMSGRYQTLVHIGSELGGKPSMAPPPSRGRAPTRIQLYGNKPQSAPSGAINYRPHSSSSSSKPHQQTYFGGHYNAPKTPKTTTSTTSQWQTSSSRALTNNNNNNNKFGGSGGEPTIYLGRRDQQQYQHQARPAPALIRRNRSPIKIPWR